MGAICNGIVLHGLTRPYGGTFLVFSDYMRPAVRLAALMGLPVTYVWTHDSIGLGEDGPTHQPVEHLWALRAIPGLDVVRPGDANETVVAWRTVLEHTDRPAGLCLSRQNMPVFDRSASAAAVRAGAGFASADGAARGGYVLADAPDGRSRGDPHRHRQRGADRGRGAGAAGGRRHRRAGGLHAVRGMVRRAGRFLPAGGAAAARCGHGCASRRASPSAGGRSSVTRARA